MKANNKQGLPLRGNRSVAAPLSHTLNIMGTRKTSGDGRRLNSVLKKHSLLNSATEKFGLNCSNDARAEQLGEAVLEVANKKKMEAELKELRYHLEQNVELRTSQQAKRIALLESCNAKLCDKLNLAQRESAALKQKLVDIDILPTPELASQPIPSTQAIDCEQLQGISDWARNMIRWRVSAAGTIA